MGVSQRRKGARFERHVARQLSDALPGVMVTRYGEVQRDGRGDVPDVRARGILAVEAKHHANYPSIPRELATAAERCGPGEWPVAWVRADRRDGIVAMREDDFLELLGLWWTEAGGRIDAAEDVPAVRLEDALAELTIGDAVDALDGRIVGAERGET